jgi:hypothetical protein
MRIVSPTWEMPDRTCIQLLEAMHQRISEKAWRIQGLWWTRITARFTKMWNDEPQSSHWMNRRVKEEMECQ